MKKILALMLAATFTLGTLAGCGSEPAPSVSVTPDASSKEDISTPAEKQKLIVSTWDSAADDHLTDVVTGFEARNPNVEVEILDIPGSEYSNKLSVMLNGGSDLDVVIIKDADTSKDIWAKGQLEDLTPYLAADSVDVSKFNGLEQNFAFEGEQAALPYRTDYYVLYYNKDIFDAAGVPYPSNDMTWDEFEATAAKLTSGEGPGKKYGALIHTWQACVQNWASQGGEFNMMQYDKYEAFAPYYDMALRMQNDAKSSMDFGTLKTSNIHYSSPFLQGNIAMMPMGSWFMATIINKIELGESAVNWGVATLPHPEGVPAGSVVGAATPMCINKASENKDLAWDFINYTTSDEGSAIMAGTGKIPATATDETLDIIAAMAGMPEGIKEALKYTSITPDRPIVDNAGDINRMLGEEHGLIMLGENTVAEGIASMKTRAEEILTN